MFTLALRKFEPFLGLIWPTKRMLNVVLNFKETAVLL